MIDAEESKREKISDVMSADSVDSDNYASDESMKSNKKHGKKKHSIADKHNKIKIRAQTMGSLPVIQAIGKPVKNRKI